MQVPPITGPTPHSGVPNPANAQAKLALDAIVNYIETQTDNYRVLSMKASISDVKKAIGINVSALQAFAATNSLSARPLGANPNKLVHDLSAAYNALGNGSKSDAEAISDLMTICQNLAKALG
jgi:hypothetical protein